MTKQEAIVKLKELGCTLKVTNFDVGGGSDCVRKTPYTRAAAGLAKGRLADKGMHTEAYQCHYCKQWHLARGRDKNGQPHK